MRECDIIERIKAICVARSWSFYRLAKKSGITYSTLCTMLHKANAPSMSTLIKICNGLEITLAEFFDEGNERVLLTDTQRKHLDNWDALSIENRQIVDNYIRFLLTEQDNQ